MEQSLKNLVVEIIILTLLLVVVVPICVHASNQYQEERNVLLTGKGTSVDISNNGSMKKITIYSNYDREMRVHLILKITKFSGDYFIYLSDQVYDIKNLEYREDEEYRYYNLGIYEVYGMREFDFQLKVKEQSYYDPNICYSFITEGVI
ncbi:MAG: hypothetical protein MR598_06875 [Erysipelotrichaceae bacterium]|nr:hypothetical protein [Erysipelotrichaceae bacterium]